MNKDIVYPAGEGRPLAQLMEWFPDLHKAEFRVPAAKQDHSPGAPPPPQIEGLTARCPNVHIGDFEGILHFVEDDDGLWSTYGCDMGCTPAKVFEDAKPIDARQPGDDDGAPPEKKSSKRVLADQIIPLSRALLQATPPPRRYMLRDVRTGAGTYLQGTAGLFAGAGGSGKSFALDQLAVCCATGLTWFGAGGWSPVEVLRVLLLAGEEDREELARRIYYTSRAAGAISDELLDLVAKNLNAIPLHGRGVALTADEGFQQRTGGLPETAFAQALRELLVLARKEGRPYGLVIIDPFSRFAGFDAEKDNASATRWVQVIETLITEETGKPSVIISHHTKKRAHNDKTDANADLIRGASALKDGVRWAAVLEQQKKEHDAADLLTLRIVKANGVPPQVMPMVLCRDQKHEGALRIATNAETESHEKVASILKTKNQQVEAYEERVRNVVDATRTYNRNDIVELVKGNRGLVLEAVRQLVKKEYLFEPKKGLFKVAVPASSGKVPDPPQSAASSGSGSPPFSALAEGGTEPAAPSPQQASFDTLKSSESSGAGTSSGTSSVKSDKGGSNGPG